VHRLVAIAFIGEQEGMQVNHKNGIKSDNRIENLEWVTPSQNIRHSINELGKARYYEFNANAKLNWHKALEIRELRRSGKSVREIMRIFGVTQTCVRDVLGGKRWMKNESAERSCSLALK
jgi:hypothetical protein